MNSRWLTCGLERLKKNHGIVRPRNVAGVKSPEPGTVRASGCSRASVSNTAAKPPSDATTSSATSVAATIINSACSASVHITDRMPAMKVKSSARAVATATPVVKPIAPSVIPLSRYPTPASCTAA